MLNSIARMLLWIGLSLTFGLGTLGCSGDPTAEPTSTDPQASETSGPSDTPTEGQSPTPSEPPTTGPNDTPTPTPEITPTTDSTPREGARDRDGDGYSRDEGDCDDEDPDRRPFAAEGEDENGDGIIDGNGVDNNCNNLVDDETGDYDDDGDGANENGSGESGEVDCDDRSSIVRPGQTETCSGRDDDCDGRVDNVSPGQDGCVTGAVECVTEISDIACATSGDCDDVNCSYTYDSQGEVLDATCAPTSCDESGYCLKTTCEADGGGAGGLQTTGEGDGLLCETDEACGAGAFCQEGVCYSSCDSDAACGDDRCTFSGRCGACSLDADCDDGEVCSDRARCVARECFVDGDCEDGFCSVDGTCESFIGNRPPDDLGLVFHPCGDATAELDEVSFPRGLAEFQICLGVYGLDGGAVDNTPITTALAVLSRDGASNPYRDDPLLTLTFPGGGATFNETTHTWAIELTPGSEVPLLLSLGDAGYDDWYDASPTVRAVSGLAPADLNVFIPGLLGGAFKGALRYDNNILSDRAFTAIVEPGGYPAHNVVLPGSANPLGTGDVAAKLVEAEADGSAFTLTWWEPLDVDATGARLGGELAFSLLDRAIYRRFELTIADTSTGLTEGNRFTGTFVETVRGLAPGEVTFTGSVTFGEAPLVSERYDAELADDSAAFWSDAASFESAFGAAAFSPSAQLSGLCSSDYSVGSGGLARARCLETGEGNCGFVGPATVLDQHLEGVETAFAGNPDSADYGDRRYASSGVCDVELDLYFQWSDYGGEDTRPAPYSAYLDQAPGGGSCDDGQAGGYVYAPGDTSFAPCCIDPNRLHCAAEFYGILSAFGVSGGDTDDARDEIWGPIAKLFAAHVYDLQELRFIDREREFTPGGGGFTIGERLGGREAAVARLLPVLRALLLKNVVSGLDASADVLGERCTEGSECAYEEAVDQITGSLAAHMDALEELGQAWQQNRSEDDDVNVDRGAWLAQVGQLELMVVAYLHQLADGGGLNVPTALASRGERLRARGGRLDTLGDRIVRDINPWGYPNNYIPNPTNKTFEGRLVDAASRVEDAADFEYDVFSSLYDAEVSKADQLTSLQSKVDAMKQRRSELCGGSASAPATLETCGAVEGSLYQAFQTLQDKVDAEVKAGRLLDQVVDRIQIKQAEAQASFDALHQLRAEYQANYEDLQDDLNDIQSDYIDGWQARFEDYQDKKADLYGQLQSTYAALNQSLQAKRTQLQSERQTALYAKCDAMQTKVSEAQAQAVVAQQTACDKIVGCLQQAEAKKKKKKRRRRFFKAVLTGGLSEVARAARGGDREKDRGCSESCRKETECAADSEIQQIEDSVEVAQLTEECTFQGRELAIDGQEMLAEAWAEEQQALAQLQLQQEDARLEEWTRFREEQMRFQIERQEDRARRAAQQADQQAGVKAQVDLARAQFDSELGMLMVDLGEVEATLSEIEAQVDAAADRLARLFELAEAAFEEESRLSERLNGERQADPAFRLVENEDVFLMDTYFERAKEYTWLALRAYEFETSTAFEYRDLLTDAMTSEQLCGLVECLEDSYNAYNEAYTIQGNKERILSARELLGFTEPVVDTRTGDEFDPGRRFGAYLSSTNQLLFEPGNGYTWAVRVQTHSTPRGSWNWDANRCNEKIESIQVLVLCEGCTSRSNVEVRVGPGGAMLYHSCQTGDARGFEDIGFDAPEDLSGFSATLTAKVIEPPADGDIIGIDEAVWAQAEANTELSGLNPIFPAWNLTLVPPEVGNAVNSTLTVPAVEDILLRINYRDRNATSWGGVEAQLPNCEGYVPRRTVLNESDSYTCEVF